MSPWYSSPPGSRVLLRTAREDRFDGNHTDDISNWLFPTDDFGEITQRTWD